MFKELTLDGDKQDALIKVSNRFIIDFNLSFPIVRKMKGFYLWQCKEEAKSLLSSQGWQDNSRY